MHRQRDAQFVLTLLLLLLLTACGDGQERPNITAKSQTNEPVTVTTLAKPTETPMPTSSPIPTATSPLREIQAQRSDFVVPLPTPTVSPPPTPTDLVTRPLTNTLAQEMAAAAGCTYAAQFVADVTIPDGTELSPGTRFVKTWRLRNNGACDWPVGLQLVFIQGEPMDGSSTVPVSPTLAGDTVDVSIVLTVPQTYGGHVGHWGLRNPDGQIFGDGVYARIVVPSPTPPPVPETASTSRLVLLNYFTWYDTGSWDDCNISAGDQPLQPYHSDDPSAIARHVRTALDAGADGFTSQWFAPGDRTDRNFATLLAQAQGTNFRSTVVFLRHIWPGSPAPTQANVAQAIRYILEQYGGHPNFLTLDGKPVLFITDLYRVPLAAGQTPQQAWAAIRVQADPNGDAWWIAEGLDLSYLAVFDGLWVYKITHAAYPNAYFQAGQWAEGVRQWETQTGKRKLWIGTLTPGWDDLRAGCRTDIRAPSQAHQQARQGGTFYRATFDAALNSRPDWLWVNSFNEWVEGTYIEPSALYGDLYVQMTREFAALFKGQ